MGLMGHYYDDPSVMGAQVLFSMILNDKISKSWDGYPECTQSGSAGIQPNNFTNRTSFLQKNLLNYRLALSWIHSLTTENYDQLAQGRPVPTRNKRKPQPVAGTGRSPLDHLL